MVDIDYDQTGFGELHAVPELKRQLPRTARLARRFAGPDRDDYFSAIFTHPVKYHPSDQFDWDRTQPEFAATDDAGQFLWVPAIVIASLQAGTQIHARMKNFPVYVAYIIDNTAGLDDQLDFAKCDSIGWGAITAVDDPPDVESRSG
ncbi:hypothetical protein [Mycobacterium branderi]|uniref:hypothetical protein n=1 Tax=Mycobacterium branderi TaxID=43348 RepID=UPI00111C225A|nr:hypothetical protein [Mycobacterium branderi]MCV7231434.1 hypothetical protein [Mycobacterium branderi]